MSQELQKYDFLFDSIDMGIICQQADGRILEVNRSAEKILGIPKKDLVADHFNLMKLGAVRADGSSLPQDEYPANLVLASGKPAGNIIIGLNNATSKTLKWIKINAVPEFRPNEKKPFLIYSVFCDITEQLQNQRELDHFKEAVDHSTNAVTMATPEGIVYYHNKAFIVLFGKSAVKKPEKLFVDKDLARDILKTTRSGNDWEGIVEMKTGSNHPLTVKLRSYPIKESKGKILGLVSVYNDISPQVEAKKELEEREAMLRMALEGAKADGWIINLATREVLFSDTWALYFGYSPEEIPNTIQGMISIIHPDDVASNQKALEEHIKGTKSLFESEVRIRHKNGNYSWILVRGKVVDRDENGTPLKIIGTSFDISDKQEISIALKESEDHFRQLAEESPNMIFINQGGKVVYANKICENLTRYKVSEFYDPDFNFMDLIDKDDHEKILSNFAKHRKGEELSPYEYRLIAKTGEKLDVIINSKLINYKQKKAILGIVTDVTRLKETEQTLKLSEQKLQQNLMEMEAIINALPGMVSVVDKDFRVIIANEELINQFHPGGRADALGRKCYETRKGLKLPCPQCGLLAAFETGKEVVRLSTPEEEELMGVATKAYAIPLRDDNGNIWGGVEVIMDISDLRKAEKAIAESEKKFRHLIEHGGECITLINVDGEVIYESPGTRFVTGYTVEERIGKNSLDLIFNEDLPAVKKILSTIAKTPGGSISAQFRAIRKDKKIYWVSGTATNMLHDPNVNALVINYKDITRQKEAEEALKLSEERFRRIFEEGPVGITIAGSDFKFIAANPAFCRMLGYSLKELQNKTFTDILKPERLNEYRKLANDLKEGRIKQIKTEKQYVRKDGSLIWGSLLSTTIRDEEGNVIYYLAMIKDISDIKEAQKALHKQIDEYQRLNTQYKEQNKQLRSSLKKINKINRELELAKQKAEESDHLKTAFLANMSHEIRTPMNGILGFADLLKQTDLSSREHQKYVDIIQKSGHRMLNIINDLIDISKIEAGQVEIDIRATNINKVLDNFNSFFLPEAGRKNVQLICRKTLRDHESIINTDETKLSQILSNLIKNALKYTTDGKIEIGYELKDQILEFRVKDTGTGIDPDSQKFIFERFRQGRHSIEETVEGSGLGLAISKAFLELLGGKIWVESQVGKGSSFYFTLPYVPVHPVSEQKRVSTDPDFKGDEFTILLAEDDESSMIYVNEIFKKQKVKILHVTNGLDAVKAVEENPEIDLILMDIKMPVMDGFEATRKIKQIRMDLPVIAQTAFASIMDNQKALKAGCDDYITKPVHRQLLVEKVRKFLTIQ